MGLGHNRNMRWIFCLVAALALAMSAETSLTVDQLVKFIHSAVQLKQPDKQVAEYLKHVKMAEKLDEKTIEDLQGQGAGPKTVAALKELGAASATLSKAAAAPATPAKAVYVEPPPPDSTEQGKIVEETREYVQNYTKNLPNFICAQVTRRDIDPTGTGTAWRRDDTITAKLSYNEGREDYQVVMVNNTTAAPGTTMEKLGGAISMGEFGSMMKQIFDFSSNARFEWDHWGTLRGRATYVFAYDIQQQFSQFHVIADKTNDIVPAYRGKVYIDKDTRMVTKITQVPYDMPAAFPIHDVELQLDYDFTKIGDQEFLLPLKSVNSSRSTRSLSKNEIEFRLYRKFGTESTIKFDTPEPLPDDKTREKDEKPPKKP
jgi:hypothetical protein